MKTAKQKEKAGQERRWMLITDGWVHGIKRYDFTLLRSVPSRSMVRSTVSLFSVSKAFVLIAALALAAALVLLLVACQFPQSQKGGKASTTISRSGHTNAVTLAQSDNPKEPSKQMVQSEQTIEYVLPPGTAIQVGAPSFYGTTGVPDYRTTGLPRDGTATNQPGARGFALLDRPVPVRMVAKDRTETSIGAAQKDTVREWAGKAANMQPVMWAGIAMMTLVAGVLLYFGWWTKAAVAVAVGIGMVVLAQTLPDHGAIILLGGLGVFGIVALLILYAYYKGQLDKNQNGIPDFLERSSKVSS